MPNKEEIWVLGNKSTISDRSFRWNEEIPNITDADIVILDLNTLHTLDTTQPPATTRPHELATSRTDNHIKKLFASVFRYLIDKIKGGGHIIFLLCYNEVYRRNYERNALIPFGIELVKVADRAKIYYSDHHFKEYLKKVQSVNYILKVPEQIQTDERSNFKLKVKNNSLVTDKLDKVVGVAFDMIDNGKSLGQLSFLPSLSPGTSREMIDIVVSELRGDVTPSPSWASNLEVAGIGKIKGKIADLESKKTEIEKEIAKQKSKEAELGSHRKLLYATGEPLEKAVKAAFVMLGFAEIEQVREKNYEDWRINFEYVLDVNVGVIEVKGVEKRTGEGNLRQCETWTNDYLLMDPPIEAKGIFVSNQHRLSAFPESKEKRKHFEPNELKFAEVRNICIIPSYVLFESVNKVLSGHTPDRKKIEQLIFKTNGVLESIL